MVRLGGRAATNPQNFILVGGQNDRRDLVSRQQVANRCPGRVGEIRGRNPGSVEIRCQFIILKSGVSRLCRLAAPGMMKMELGLGSLWLEAGVGKEADDHWSLEPACQSGPDVAAYPEAPDSWGARGAECLPCDVPRRSSPATSSRDGTTARRCLCHGTGSGTTEARPPASSVPPAPHGVWGVVAPRGQSRAGFSEQQFIILILARKDEPTLDYPRKDELTPDYPRAPTLAATPQQQQRTRKTRMNLFRRPPPLSTISAAPFLWNPAHRVQAVNCVSIPTLAGSRPGSRHIG